jgi:hypothetical protein
VAIFLSTPPSGGTTYRSRAPHPVRPQEGDQGAVGGPLGTVIGGRSRGQRDRIAGANLLHVNVAAVVLLLPFVDDLRAIGREARVCLGAQSGGQRQNCDGMFSPVACAKRQPRDRTEADNRRCNA